MTIVFQLVIILLLCAVIWLQLRTFHPTLHPHDLELSTPTQPQSDPPLHKETFDTLTLSLCNGEGEERAEISIHQAEAPSSYTYGDVVYHKQAGDHLRGDKFYVYVAP